MRRKARTWGAAKAAVLALAAGLGPGCAELLLIDGAIAVIGVPSAIEAREKKRLESEAEASREAAAVRGHSRTDGCSKENIEGLMPEGRAKRVEMCRKRGRLDAGYTP